MEAFMGSSYKEKEVVNNQEEDDDEYLKTRISSHPLYGLLLQTHLDCLKVGDHDLEESDALMDYWKQLDNHKSNTSGEPELDHFMEAYCLALRKLKEEMEEPQRRSMTFIANMHHQLKELSLLDRPDSPATYHHHSNSEHKKRMQLVHACMEHKIESNRVNSILRNCFQSVYQKIASNLWTLPQFLCS